MITFLEGILVEASPNQATMNVNGVGYEVLIPLSSYDRLPEAGNRMRIFTHLAVREDAHVLYGFASNEERELFRLLIGAVSGIGPKIALNVLSGMTPVSFRGAVSSGDVKALSRISGLGKKTAERIVVELKDKIGPVGAWEASSADRSLGTPQQIVSDAVAALVSLGFKQQDAHERVKEAQAMLGEKAELDTIVKASLKQSK